LYNDMKIDLKLNRKKTHNGELVKMYKFHLINTKRMSSKTRCDHVLSLEENTFLWGQDFSFYYMFKINFSGHNKIGEHGPRMPPLATGLPVKQKFRSGMKILLHYVFG